MHLSPVLTVQHCLPVHRPYCYQLSIRILIDQLLIGSLGYQSIIDKTTLLSINFASDDACPTVLTVGQCDGHTVVLSNTTLYKGVQVGARQGRVRVVLRSREREHGACDELRCRTPGRDRDGVCRGVIRYGLIPRSW